MLMHIVYRAVIRHTTIPTHNWRRTVKCMLFIIVNTDWYKIHCFFSIVWQLTTNHINDEHRVKREMRMNRNTKHKFTVLLEPILVSKFSIKQCKVNSLSSPGFIFTFIWHNISDFHRVMATHKLQYYYYVLL